MEDKHDHEIMLKNIYIRMLEYKIHDEYNNLKNAYHRYMLINKIKFHFEWLEEKKKIRKIVSFKSI